MPTRPVSKMLTDLMPFSNEAFNGQLLRSLGHIYDRGADLGDCLSTALRIRDGDPESWYMEWHRLASKVEDDALDERNKGHTASARDAFLRAAEYHRQAEFFLRGDLDDKRIMMTADLVRFCFRSAGEMLDAPFQPIEVPYENTTLPGYFLRPDGSSGPRPTVIVLSGYDSFCEEGYCSFARAALERGFNAVMFDGPGQGQCLRRQRLSFRADWESVMTPVLDFVQGLPGVDKERMVLVGRSFAGYLAPRAAAFDRRPAALIADPGLYDLGRVLRERLPPGTIEVIERGEGERIDDEFAAHFAQDPMARFYFHSRMAAHGIDTVSGYLHELMRYNLRGIAENIECPTLIATAGGTDPLLGGQSKELYDAVSGPKELVRFSSEEGAGDHCEAGAPSLFYQRIFDRLEEFIGPAAMERSILVT